MNNDRYILLVQEDGKLRPYNQVDETLPWEDRQYLVIDTRPCGTRYDAGNVVVARFDEGTAFPNNPLTQAWAHIDELNRKKATS